MEIQSEFFDTNRPQNVIKCDSSSKGHRKASAEVVSSLGMSHQDHCYYKVKDQQDALWQDS